MQRNTVSSLQLQEEEPDLSPVTAAIMLCVPLLAGPETQAGQRGSSSATAGS